MNLHIKLIIFQVKILINLLIILCLEFLSRFN